MYFYSKNRFNLEVLKKGEGENKKGSHKKHAKERAWASPKAERALVQNPA